MSKIIDNWYKKDRMPNEWFKLLQEKWRCDKGDNPNCTIDDIEIDEKMRKCVSDLQTGCEACCILYQGDSSIELRDPKNVKFRMHGPFYLRTIYDGSWYHVLIQQKEKLGEI